MLLQKQQHLTATGECYSTSNTAFITATAELNKVRVLKPDMYYICFLPAMCNVLKRYYFSNMSDASAKIVVFKYQKKNDCFLKYQTSSIEDTLYKKMLIFYIVQL